MEEQLSATGIILEVLGDLELPILNPLVKANYGYEVLLELPAGRKLTKDILQKDLEDKELRVIDIDVFRDRTGHYAWIIVTPNKREAQIG